MNCMQQKKENPQLKYRTLSCIICEKLISSRTRAKDKTCIKCIRKIIPSYTNKQYSKKYYTINSVLIMID